jgi:hypothetical protein
MKSLLSPVCVLATHLNEDFMIGGSFHLHAVAAKLPNAHTLKYNDFDVYYGLAKRAGL